MALNRLTKTKLVSSRTPATRRQSPALFDFGWQRVHEVTQRFCHSARAPERHQVLIWGRQIVRGEQTHGFHRWRKLTVSSHGILGKQVPLQWHVNCKEVHHSPLPATSFETLGGWDSEVTYSKTSSAYVTHAGLDPRSPSHGGHPFHFIFMGPNATLLTCRWGRV